MIWDLEEIGPERNLPLSAIYGRRDLPKTKDSLPTGLTMLLVRSEDERWSYSGGCVPIIQIRMTTSIPLLRFWFSENQS
jgi:hypothetical protein